VAAERFQFEIDTIRDIFCIRNFRNRGPDLVAQDALHRPGFSGAFLKPGAAGAFDGFGADFMGDPVIPASFAGMRKIEDPRPLRADNPGETSQIFGIRRETTVRIPKKDQVVDSHEGGGLARLCLADPPELLLGMDKASRFAGGHVDHGDCVPIPYKTDDASPAADDIVIRMGGDNEGLHDFLSPPLGDRKLSAACCGELLISLCPAIIGSVTRRPHPLGGDRGAIKKRVTSMPGSPALWAGGSNAVCGSDPCRWI